MEDRTAPTAPAGGRDRRLVTARVPRGTTPTAAPADLARYVTPKRRGGVAAPIDWELDPARFAASAPVASMAGIARRFAAWRATWASRFPLAEVPEVAEFARFAAAEQLLLLGRLTAAAVYTPDELEDLDAELAAAEVILEQVRAHGWRFRDTASGRVLRVASATGRLHGNTGEDWEVVVVAGRGVRLRVAAEVHDVAGWAITRTGVLLTTTEGHPEGTEVHLTGAPARGLAQLAPSAPRVSVEQVPLAVAWKPLLDALTAAVTDAAPRDATVVVTPEL